MKRRAMLSMTILSACLVDIYAHAAANGCSGDPGINNGPDDPDCSMILNHSKEKLINVEGARSGRGCGNTSNGVCGDAYTDVGLEDGGFIENMIEQNGKPGGGYVKSDGRLTEQSDDEMLCRRDQQGSCAAYENIQYDRIDKCLKYYTDAEGRTRCALCSDGYLTSFTGEKCVKHCSKDFIHFVTFIETDEENNIVDIKRNTCQPRAAFESLKHCMLATTDSRYINEVRCMECDEGFVPTQGCYENQIFDKVDDLKNVQNDDFGVSYSYVECLERTPKSKFMPPEDFRNPLCESYILEKDTFYCHKCKFGYTGKILRDSATDIAYLDCDHFVLNCDSEVHYGGSMFDDWLEDMFAISVPHDFTCHKCFGSQIPFIHLSSDLILTPYEVPTEHYNAYQLNEPDQNYHTVCKRPSDKGLWVDKDNFVEFPSNCALGLYIVDGPDRVDIETSKAYCVACKPGYRRVFTDQGFFISSCQRIENCDVESKSNIWMNYCKSCRRGYAWSFDPSDSKIHFDRCVETKTNNCLAAENHLECGLCRSRYVLSAFKKCKRIENSVCRIFLDVYNKSFNKNVKKVYLEMFFKMFLNDCLGFPGLRQYSYLN